ncbi:MAG: hypothetical protein FWG13_06510 [Leptospirales bacterium]|nr:hypothetical protein [Leptospirales bacterium]
MANKILIAACIIALNICAFTGVVSHGDFIDWTYYPIVILLLFYIFYRYYSKFPIWFIFFNLLIITKYFDSLNKVKGFPYPDGIFTDFLIGSLYFIIHIFFIAILIRDRPIAGNKRVMITVILLFSILCYTPIISAPSSFVRQIIGAQLIQDDKNEIYCVTKIDKKFISALGGIYDDDYGRWRICHAYKFSGIDNRYIYRTSFVLKLGYSSGGGTMDPQSANMKNYYINVNRFFFKLSKDSDCTEINKLNKV